jgi:hypothetical protein
MEMAEDNPEFNFDAIFKHRLNDPDAEIRIRAIQGLWENEETSLIDHLIKIMKDDISPGVRKEAAMALGRFAMLSEHQKLDPDYIHMLSEALLYTFDDDEDIEVKRRALEAASRKPASVSHAMEEEGISKDRYKTQGQRHIFIWAGKTAACGWVNNIIKELSNPMPKYVMEAAEKPWGGLGEVDIYPLVSSRL